MSKPQSPLAVLKNMTRDQRIVICYRSGDYTQQTIADAFDISRARVQQVLKKAGVTAKDNPKTPHGELYSFIGCHVLKTVKKNFEAIATRRKLSVSALARELINAEVER